MKKILPVLLLQFVNGMGFALFIPVFPYLVEGFGQGELFYGLLLSSYSLCQFFVAPLFGRLSDTYGRRQLLIWSQFGTLLSFGIFGYALASGLEGSVAIWGVSSILRGVLLSRVLDGITGGNVSVANAYLSDVTLPEDKTKSFGLMGAMIGLAMIIGPAIGSRSMTRGIGYFGPALFGAVLSLITLIYMFMGLPESLDPIDRNKAKINTLDVLSVTKRFSILSSYPELKKRFGLYAVFGLIFVGYTSTIVFYFKDTLGLEPTELGYLFAGVGLFLIFHMGYTVRRLSDIWSDEHIFQTGLILMGISLLGFLFSPGIWGFLAIAFVLDAGLACVIASFKGLITKRVSQSEQGTITGLEESIMAAHRAVTPLLATGFFALVGTAIYPRAGLIGLICGGLLFYFDKTP